MGTGHGQVDKKRGIYHKGSRQPLYAEARRLREEHHYGYRRIAEILGVPRSTIQSWTHDVVVPVGEAMRQWSEEHQRDITGTGKDAVKRRLIQLRGYVCETCGFSEWMGKPITLELHRKIPSLGYVDENCELLCPNCHSLTPTWKNRRCE